MIISIASSLALRVDERISVDPVVLSTWDSALRQDGGKREPRGGASQPDPNGSSTPSMSRKTMGEGGVHGAFAEALAEASAEVSAEASLISRGSPCAVVDEVGGA